MAKSFSFDTGHIHMTDGYDTNFTIKGTITRKSKSKVHIKATVYTRYSIYHSGITFHFACSNTHKSSFKGNYPGIASSTGYTELKTSSGGNKGVKIPMYTSGNKTFTICDRDFTIPDSKRDGKIYFATWFSAHDYYHVDKGKQVYYVTAGRMLKSSLYLDPYYTAPSNLKLNRTGVTSSSLTFEPTWKAGVNTTDEKAKISANNESKTITESGDTVKFTGLVGNRNYKITGKLYDGTKESDSTDGSYYTMLNTPSEINIIKNNKKSIEIKAKSSNDANKDSTEFKLWYKYRCRVYLGGEDYIKWDGISAISYDSNFTMKTGADEKELIPNTQYQIQAISYRKTDVRAYSDSVETIRAWTAPSVSLELSLVPGREYDSIKAVAKIEGSNSNLKYAFAVDSGAYPKEYISTNNFTFSGLSSNSDHIVRVKCINTVSELESEATATLATVGNPPVLNLKVQLISNWYDKLKIGCTFKYVGNIRTYEFAIYDNLDNRTYEKVSKNEYLKSGLKANTVYTCEVRLTDDQGRVYTDSAQFRTLDDRSLFLIPKDFNTVLQTHITLITPKNEQILITPNLLNIIDDNDKIINMNKIINNDDREEFE